MTPYLSKFVVTSAKFHFEHPHTESVLSLTIIRITHFSVKCNSNW